MSLQWYDIALIAVLILIIFGPRRLPELAKSVGKAINEFKAAMSGAKINEDEPKKIEEATSGKNDTTPAG